jgi:hypothetical protein
MVHLLRHRCPKGAVTVATNLPSPRHIPTLLSLRPGHALKGISREPRKRSLSLPEQGRRYDAPRSGGGVAVELRSHLTIRQQMRVIGATWLDQQLISGGKDLGERGFGGEAREALRQRADFLIEQGLAELRGQRVIMARNLLTTLRERDIEAAG